MSYNDKIIFVLFGLQGVLLGLCLALLIWLTIIRRREQRPPTGLSPSRQAAKRQQVNRPVCWVAVRSTSPEKVQAALGLEHVTPCTWLEGLNGEHDFFVSCKVNNWVLVTGMGLPNPTDDVDATFLFLTSLSRQLGHVQYFYGSRMLKHHAWARLDDGCVTRAYAWTGETVWNQGVETLPEIETGMQMFQYAAPEANQIDGDQNYQRVPQLASRWSLDPTAIPLKTFHPVGGTAGESTLS